MKRAETVLSIVVFFIGAWSIYLSTELSYSYLYAPGPGFLPFWIGIFLMLFSLALFIRSVRVKPGQKINWPGCGMSLKLFILLLSFFLYLMCIPRLGYTMGTILFCVCLVKLLSLHSSWLNSFIISNLVTIPIILVMDLWFKVPLPKGIFESFQVWGIIAISAGSSFLFYLGRRVMNKCSSE